MEIEFEGELWLWESGATNWVFVTVPKPLSEEIHEHCPIRTNGFGSVKVLARTGDVEWSTSVWPEKKSGCYLLAIKAQVRKKAQIGVGDTVKFNIQVLDQP